MVTSDEDPERRVLKGGHRKVRVTSTLVEDPELHSKVLSCDQIP